MTLLLSRRSALRLAAASAVTLAAPASLMAAPISYRLNPGRSRVGFGVNLGGSIPRATRAFSFKARACGRAHHRQRRLWTAMSPSGASRVR